MLVGLRPPEKSGGRRSGTCGARRPARQIELGIDAASDAREIAGRALVGRMVVVAAEGLRGVPRLRHVPLGVEAMRQVGCER